MALSIPPVSFVRPGFERVLNRTHTKYSVQITDQPQGVKRTIKVITVTLDLPAQSNPNRIRELLNQKVGDFLAQNYRGMIGVSATVVGRIDIEI